MSAESAVALKAGGDHRGLVGCSLADQLGDRFEQLAVERQGEVVPGQMFCDVLRCGGMCPQQGTDQQFLKIPYGVESTSSGPMTSSDPSAVLICVPLRFPVAPAVCAHHRTVNHYYQLW